MKAVIYRYPVEYRAGIQFLTIPQDAEFLHIDVTTLGRPVLYYKVLFPMLDTSDIRQLQIIETGDMFTTNSLDKYLGTYSDGSETYHIFDITDRE